jgi:hypothetical protein
VPPDGALACCWLWLLLLESCREDNDVVGSFKSMSLLLLLLPPRMLVVEEDAAAMGMARRRKIEEVSFMFVVVCDE